jgi:S-adenosyl-L-methionine hydrolase (adenosine-forming)
MAIITLTTDFGLKDGNVAIMKGVIWQINPAVQIVDLSHLVEPYNVLEASLILFHAAFDFPDNTIHVIVVDPGVGTNRRPIAAKIGSQFFVCPDNGILTQIANKAKKCQLPVDCFHLTDTRYWLPTISHVFHGRDIFAPVAAHLASNIEISMLGVPIHDFIKLEVPAPRKTSHGWRGRVIYIDNFGNIATNLFPEHIEARTTAVFRANNLEIKGMVHTFGDNKNGELIALFGGPGNVIFSIVNGNAALQSGIAIGDEIEVVSE